MRKLLTPLFVAIGLLVLLAGCSSPPLTGFTIELLKLEQAADGSITATMRLNNPNVVAYNVETSQHAVFLDGKLAGSIKVERPEGVPPQATVTETGVFIAAPGVTLSTGSFSYRLESMLMVLLYGDSKEKQKLTSSGKVEVSLK